VTYPRPLVPRIVIPLQMEATISIVKTQKPRDRPARMKSSEVLTFLEAQAPMMISPKK